MSDKGLKSLDEIWESMDDGGDLSDGPDGGLDIDDGDDSAVVESQPQVDEGQEQSDEDDFVPAKLSDLYAQDDEDGQGEDAPDLLAQEITLSNGEVVPIQELIHRQEEMRKDYTQKTQTLAEERKAFETEREQLQAVAELRDLLTNEPTQTVAQMAVQLGLISEEDARWAANRGFTGDPESIIPKKGKDTPSPEDVEALIEQKAQEKLEELLGSNPVVQQIEAQQAVTQVNTIFDQIEQSYGTELDHDDRVAVLKASVDWGQDNLEYVFLRLNSALEQQQAAKGRVKGGQSLKTVRSSQPNNADIVTTPPSDMDEAFARTAKKLGISLA